MTGIDTMDAIIKVDESLCIHCGSCIRVCPGGLITKDEFPVPIPNSWDLCINCGHCVAICPTGAMHQRAMGPQDCEPIDIHLIPRWDRVKQYLKMRRSIRGYIKKPVEKEKVLELLDVARLGAERSEPAGGPVDRHQRSAHEPRITQMVRMTQIKKEVSEAR